MVSEESFWPGHIPRSVSIAVTQWSAGPEQLDVMSRLAPLWVGVGPDDLLRSCPTLVGHLVVASLEGRKDGSNPWLKTHRQPREKTQPRWLWLEYSGYSSHFTALVLTAASIKCCFDSLKWGRPFFMKEFKLYPLNRKLPRSHSAAANLTSPPRPWK